MPLQDKGPWEGEGFRQPSGVTLSAAVRLQVFTQPLDLSFFIHRIGLTAPLEALTLIRRGDSRPGACAQGSWESPGSEAPAWKPRSFQAAGHGPPLRRPGWPVSVLWNNKLEMPPQTAFRGLSGPWGATPCLVFLRRKEPGPGTWPWC